MKLRFLRFFVCFCLMMLLIGCSSDDRNTDIQLTEQQCSQIETLVKHRKEWEQTTEMASVYTVNRVHIAQSGENAVILTVANVSEGTGAMKGMDIFVGVKGYAASTDVFTAIDGYHKDWLVDCASVDLELLSDWELQDVLEECYINYLTKHDE